MRSILLIAYKFPPYAGVGGLRWARMAKQLARLGHHVHLLTVAWEHTGPNTADEVLAEPNVHVHEIASGGPHRLRHRPIANRWLHAARHYAIGAVDRRRYWDDEAQRWAPHLLPAAHRLINAHRIETVIATGHPFQANRWAAQLKRERPQLRLIQDFRDPWADNPFRSLKPARAAQVRDWQREAVGAADAVVAVTEGLLSLYSEDATGRTEVISNGVDPEELDLPDGAPRRASDGPLRLTHIGNVANGRDRPLDALLQAAAARPRGSVEIELIGSGLELVARRHPGLVRSGALRLQKPLSQSQALRRAAGADYALQLNAREFPYLVSTKIYEYALLGVPTLSLNYGGEIERLIRERSLGRSIDLSGDPDLTALLDQLRASRVADRDGRFAFDVGPYTYPVLGRRYSELVQSL